MIQPVPVAILLAIALALAARGSRDGRRGFAVLALLWAGYAGYEYLMYRRILCSGECNIRVDLLLLYPLLLGGTLWVAVAALRRVAKRRQGAA